MDASELRALQTHVEVLGAAVDGIVGVYARDLTSGAEVALNADMVFPLASVVKIPILYELYRQAEAGTIDLAARIPLAVDHLVPGSGVLQDLDPGLAPTVRDLATLMITVSDNVATDRILHLVGRAGVEATMRGLGLGSIAIPMTIRGILYNTVGLDETNPAHTYDLYQQRSREKYIDWQCRAYGDADNNVASPRDLGRLLADIAQRQTLAAPSYGAMIDILKRQKYNTILPLHLPEGVEVAHKTGSLRGIRNDVGIVYAPAGPYLIAVCAKRLADAVAGSAALAQISRAVWERFVGPIPPPRYGPAPEAGR